MPYLVEIGPDGGHRHCINPVSLLPTLAIDPASITGTPFPFLNPSHGLTFCFEVVNARDITIPQFIRPVKDDIIQVARLHAAIDNDVFYDSDENEENDQISSNDSTDDVSDVEDFRDVRLQRFRNELAAQNLTILRHLNC